MAQTNSLTRTSGALATIAGAGLAGCLAAGPARRRRLPAPVFDPPSSGLQTAVLSGGCFWGVQGVFEHVKGVRKVWAGYAGGKRGDASYDQVSTGTTGHAESVQIQFDPAQISYGQILRIFFSVATDPTQVDRQFPDVGPQYRSEIFYRDADPEDRRPALHRPARRGARLRPSDRHPGRSRHRLFPRRSSSSGLTAPSPEPALHRHIRHAQADPIESSVPGRLARRPGPGALTRWRGPAPGAKLTAESQVGRRRGERSRSTGRSDAS